MTRNRIRFRFAILSAWLIVFIPWCVYALDEVHGALFQAAHIAIGATVVVAILVAIWKTGLWLARGRQGGLKPIAFLWLKTIGTSIAILVVGLGGLVVSAFVSAPGSLIPDCSSQAAEDAVRSAIKNSPAGHAGLAVVVFEAPYQKGDYGDAGRDCEAQAKFNDGRDTRIAYSFRRASNGQVTISASW